MKSLRIALLILALGVQLAQAQQPGFTKIEQLPKAEIGLQLSSTSRYRIDVSSNLVDWIPFLSAERQSTNQVDSGAFISSNRFYSLTDFSNATLTGDHFPTDDGEVIVRPVNHASFVMSWKNAMIYNDPVGANALYAGFPKANLILVSHTHSDHFSASTLNFVRAIDGVIIAPQAVYDQMSALLKGVTIVLTNNASTNVLGIGVEAVPAYNQNHLIGTGNGYVVTIRGKRFYMAGDTGNTPEMRALQNIDVAFLCVNVPYTMTVTAAANAASAFQPRVLYPYHYQNQDGSFANLQHLKDLIGRDHPIEVRLRKWY
jgi:L-ascorbate metabolism protein UlaG (beta-lactamase superfamily)